MIGAFIQVNEDSWNAQRFPLGYVIQENGCWDWVGARNNKGYGAIGVPGRGMVGAHRWMYERTIGRVPDGLQVDHLCRNRACVNPDHMECVTSQVNTLRGDTIAARNAAKTHCVNGHQFTPENTKRIAGGKRHCRECGRRRNAA